MIKIKLSQENSHDCEFKRIQMCIEHIHIWFVFCRELHPFLWPFPPLLCLNNITYGQKANKKEITAHISFISHGICQLLMAMLTCTTILISLLLADAYETWHLVDLAQVVCPKPTSSNPDAPVFPDYNLGINYSSELQVDAPHIIGFIRASKQAMSITFKVEDFYGEQVGSKWRQVNGKYVG